LRIYPRAEWPFKIIEEQAVTARITSARQEWHRFEEIWEGIVWLIAHNGQAIGAEERTFGGVDHYVYTFDGDQVAGFPRIVVVYKYSLGAFVLRMILVSTPASD
jgi:hypothetical protein